MVQIKEFDSKATDNWTKGRDRQTGAVHVVNSLRRDARFSGWKILEDDHSILVVQRKE
jgi:hypothetical protein